MWIGGWLSISCPHKVVYALKFILRAEGPRDYIDLLLCFKYQPTIVICDMAHMVASHGNVRQPGMFSPFEGRLAEPSPTMISQAKDGGFVRNMCLTWLRDTKSSPFPLVPFLIIAIPLLCTQLLTWLIITASLMSCMRLTPSKSKKF